MMRFESSGQNYIGDEAVADAAKKILANTPDGLSLAKLGQQLSREFELPLRRVLGARKLSPILRAKLGNLIEIGGPTGSETVRLVDADRPPQRIRFDPAVWAAFAKPIKPNCKRWLSIKRPLTFDDFDESKEIPEERLEIQTSQIPDESVPHDERDKLVMDNILAWCRDHSVDPMVLSYSIKERPRPISANVPDTFVPPTSNGLTALVSLVEAIPPEERANFSIPLNLIGRLLS